MKGQTSIEVPDAPPAPQTCAWCGKPAYKTIVVEKERWRNDRGTRVVAKPAVTAPTCDAYYRSLVRTDG